MKRVSWVAVILCVLGLPLFALYLEYGDVRYVFAFPPEFGRVDHVPFKAKLTLLSLLMVFALPLVWVFFRRRDRIYRHNLVLQRRHFPKWGYVGYLILVLSWVIAWNRFDALSSVQAYTFTPLWLGFIIVVNAHVHRRSNTAPLYKTPGRFALLFLLSAIFWWAFEYLNRFTENWNYLGAEGVSSAHYFIHGSICFSTVLPAVFSVFKWLSGFNDLHRTFYLGPRVGFIKNRLFGVLSVAIGIAGMLAVGVSPQFAYPFLWLGPLMIYGGLQLVLGQFTGTSSWVRGDWRWIAFWAIAGLVCGLFWECWNFYSLIRWEYNISFFDGWPLFEMPILGYVGYLPFGAFCGLVTQLIFKNSAGIKFSLNN